MADAEKAPAAPIVVKGPARLDSNEPEPAKSLAPRLGHPRTGMTLSPTSRRRQLWTIVGQLAFFYVLALVFMAGHLVLFIKLDGQPVDDSGLDQNIQGFIANILALVAELMLLAGIGIAYTQVLWRSFRQRPLRASTIDSLMSLPGTPWDLFRPEVMRHARGIWLIGFACLLMPIAAMFPPGALTVEFQNSVSPRMLRNVPTMNISELGDGSVKAFSDYRLWTGTSDLEVGQTLPHLTALARTVVSTGQPAQWPTPCEGPCTYSMIMKGPRFHCEDMPDVKDGLFEPCTDMFWATDNAKARTNAYWMEGNSFQLSWHTEYPRGDTDERCSSSTFRSMDCSISLATYRFEITNESNGTRTIKREVLEDDEMWTEDKPVRMHYYDYFYNDDGLPADEPLDREQLYKNFAHTQAFLIRRAVTEALSGSVEYFLEGWTTNYYPTDGTMAAGSPYIGMTDRFDARIHLTEESLQTCLEDVLMSTIALNDQKSPLWNDDTGILAMEGADTYLFNEKAQFYGPYGALLVGTLLIYAAGIWALYKNGTPAGGGFLQLAKTLAASPALQQLGEATSLEQDDEAMKQLETVKLRYGIRRRTTSDGEEQFVAGFGTEAEVEPF